MAKAQLVAGGLAPRQGLQSLQLQGLEKGLGQGPVRGQGADTRRTEDGGRAVGKRAPRSHRCVISGSVGRQRPGSDLRGDRNGYG